MPKNGSIVVQNIGRAHYQRLSAGDGICIDRFAVENNADLFSPIVGTSTINISNHLIAIRGAHFLLTHDFRANASPKESASHHGINVLPNNNKARRNAMKFAPARTPGRFKARLPSRFVMCKRDFDFHENDKCSTQKLQII